MHYIAWRVHYASLVAKGPLDTIQKQIEDEMELIKRGTFLLLTEDLNVQKTCELALGDLASKLICTSDFEKAFDLIRNTYFDCIILDTASRREAGFDLLQKIHASKSNLHLIVLIYKDRKADGFQALKLGAVDFLEVPINSKMLVKAAEGILKLPRA